MSEWRRFYAVGFIFRAKEEILLKGISAEFQVIHGFSQKLPVDLLSHDKIHS